MTDLYQMRVTWTGIAGLPGVSTFYTTGPVPQFLTDLKAFFGQFSNDLPSGTVITFPADGNVINDATGQVVASWVGTAPTPLTGAASGAYAAPVGGMVTWNTARYVGGRRLKGKTFIVPLSAASYTADGEISTQMQGQLQAAADILASSTSGLEIYSPKNATSAGVTTGKASPKVAILSSRRD